VARERRGTEGGGKDKREEKKDKPVTPHHQKKKGGLAWGKKKNIPIGTEKGFFPGQGGI
jgi:hypothetical protein